MIIAIEGSDQAGKKTQTAMLAKALKSQKIKTAVFDFPDYSTVIGKEIDSYLHGKRKFPQKLFIIFMQQIDGKKWKRLKNQLQKILF